MELQLKGKKALVTGASSGLGAAAAMALAEEGVSLIINARNKDRLEKTAGEIEKKTGITPELVIADIASEKGINEIMKHVRKEVAGGGVDILVSNGGGPPAGQFLQHASRAWKDAADLVLFSAINLTKAVIDGMIERRWGRLIYITSVGVLQPLDDLILSNTYRAGVTAFCKTVSNNYAGYGITANCVCPGYTATERLTELAEKRAETAGVSSEEIMKGFSEQIPAGRVGQPEETAALIAFLASEKAAYITGSSIAVDGGTNRALI